MKNIFDFFKKSFFILKEVKKPSSREVFSYFIKVLYFTTIFGLIGFAIYLIILLIA